MSEAFQALLAQETELVRACDGEGATAVDAAELDRVQALLLETLQGRMADLPIEHAFAVARSHTRRARRAFRSDERAVGAIRAAYSRSGIAKGRRRRHYDSAARAHAAKVLDKLEKGLEAEDALDDADAPGDLEDLGEWDGKDDDAVPLAAHSVHRTLEAHQRAALEFLRSRAAAGKGAVLAYAMGLGKTRIALAFLHDRFAADRASPYAVVLCPKTVVIGWKEEYEAHAAMLGYACTVVDRTSRLAECVAAWQRDRGLLVMGYESFTTTVDSKDTAKRRANACVAERAAVLVVDEVHEFKNMRTERGKKLCRFRTPLRYGLTGTPIANSALDLLDICRFADGDFLPGMKEGDFKALFATPIKQAMLVESDDAARALGRQRACVLRKVLEPVLRYRANDWLRATLPPKSEYVVQYALAPAEYARYKQSTRQGAASLKRRDEDDVLASDVSYLTYQTSIDTHGRATRVSIAIAFLSAMEHGDAALVFCSHPATLAAIRDAMGGEAIVALIDGSHSMEQRRDALSLFQSGEVDVLCISSQAGATGLNCQRANMVLLLEPSENPTIDQQAMHRAWRFGQKRAVTVYRFVAADTVDMRIVRRGILKTNLAAALMDNKAIDTVFRRADVRSDGASELVRLQPPDAAPDALLRQLARYVTGWVDASAFLSTADDTTDVAAACTEMQKTCHNATRAVQATRREVAADGSVVHVPMRLPPPSLLKLDGVREVKVWTHAKFDPDVAAVEILFCALRTGQCLTKHFTCDTDDDGLICDLTPHAELTGACACRSRTLLRDTAAATEAAGRVGAYSDLSYPVYLDEAAPTQAS